MPKQWFPLESNPSVMTLYIKNLGVDTTEIEFHDVLSTDDWALDMIPQPVLGVLMLFQIKDVTEAHSKAERNRIETDGQVVSPAVWFTKQIVGNACGTIGLLHCIMNALNKLVIDPSSYIASLKASTDAMSADERAAILESDDAIELSHESAAAEGQSQQVEASTDVDAHFVCFTEVDGHLYELDGRKQWPINHGPCEPDSSSSSSLLRRSCDVIKQFMARDPDEMRFTIVALGPRIEEA